MADLKGPGFDAPVPVGPGLFGMSLGPHLVSCTICGSGLLVIGGGVQEPAIDLHVDYHRGRGDIPPAAPNHDV